MSTFKMTQMSSGCHRGGRVGLAVAAILLLAVAGCGSGNASSSASPTPKTSNKQTASIIAKYKPDILAAITYEDNCGDLACLTAANLVVRWHKIDDLAVSLRRELIDAKPVAPEVAGLVDRTIATVDTERQSRVAFDACTDQTHSTVGCEAQMNAFETAFRALKPQFSAWEPYTGTGG